MPETRRPRVGAAHDGRVDWKLYLVVEDDAAVASVIRTFLELVGHSAVVAPCTADADRYVEQWRFDGIVVDRRLPDRDGLGWLEWRVARDPELAGDLVLTSGVPLADEDLARVLRIGAVFLGKPFRPEVLLELLGLGAPELPEPGLDEPPATGKGGDATPEPRPE